MLSALQLLTVGSMGRSGCFRLKRRMNSIVVQQQMKLRLWAWTGHSETGCWTPPSLILVLNTGAPQSCVLSPPPVHTVQPWRGLYCKATDTTISWINNNKDSSYLEENQQSCRVAHRQQSAAHCQQKPRSRLLTSEERRQRNPEW